MERAKGIIDKLVSQKAVYIISLGYMATTLMYYVRRPVVNPGFLTVLIHELTIGIMIPFILVMFAYNIWPKSRFARLLEWLVRPALFLPFVYIFLIYCLIAAAVDMPYFLASWHSFGLIVSGLILATALLRNRVKPVEGFIMSMGLVNMWRGVWEIPYQVFYRYFYDIEQVGWELSKKFIISEIAIEIPLIAGGFIALWFYTGFTGKYKNIINFNRWTLILTVLYIAFTIGWVVTGFGVDVWYDWSDGLWKSTQGFHYYSMALWKFSKVSLLLAFISILLPKKDAEVR